jgi:ABC-type glutathione transport system ATPase component
VRILYFKIETIVYCYITLIMSDVCVQVLQHLTMAKERCDMFHGRGEILHMVAEYMNSDSRQPLAITGESGCGKTSLMAEISRLVGIYIHM